MSDELPAAVPAPVPPADRDAWYAPAVRAQYHVGEGVVATVTEEDGTFRYRTREPTLGSQDARLVDRIERRFDEATITRPSTREAARERLDEGLPSGWLAQLDRVAARTPAGRRRLGYHLGATLRGLGRLTPLALDERIRIGDTAGDKLQVHTRDFAPAKTDLPTDTPHLEEFLSERVDRRTISVWGYDVPVTIYRRRVLGEDAFNTTYSVGEPTLLPGDADHIDRVRTQLQNAPPAAMEEKWEQSVLGRARTLLRRRLRYRHVGRVVRAIQGIGRSIMRTTGLPAPPPDPSIRTDRVEDLTYYVARDLIGDGPLSVPLRDPRIRSIEVNRVAERVKVVPHGAEAGGATRMTTTESIDDEAEFRRLARALAAEGGVELSAHRPGATVEISRRAGDSPRSVTCSVSLPDDGPESGHIALRTERATAPTPVELLQRDILTPALVAAVWTLVEDHGVVLFVGPAGANPETALSAHAPFIPRTDRPVSVAERGRPIPLPHESGVTVRRGREATSHATVGNDGLDRHALNADVAVISGVDRPEAVERFGTVVTSGRGVLAAGRVKSRRFFETLGAEADLPDPVIANIDLLVELPDPDADEPATGWAPTNAPETSETAPDPPAWNGSPPTLQWRQIGDSDADSTVSVAEVLDTATSGDGATADRHATFQRRRRYVEYLQAEGMTDRSALLGFLSDLRTDEAATIERIRQRLEG